MYDVNFNPANRNTGVCEGKFYFYFKIFTFNFFYCIIFN